MIRSCQTTVSAEKRAVRSLPLDNTDYDLTDCLAFSLCTLWAVEALTRCGAYDKKLLQRGVSMFEDFLGCEYFLFLSYLGGVLNLSWTDGNHCGLWSEEISAAGEGLGNAVQGFTVCVLEPLLIYDVGLICWVDAFIARYVDFSRKYLIIYVSEPHF